MAFITWLLAFAAWVVSLLGAYGGEQPTATPVPTVVLEVPSPTPAVQPDGVHGKATFYGLSYQWRPLGCPGAGLYDTNNPTIAASPWNRAEGHVWPCGTHLEVCGPGGCAVMIVQDACPGCPKNWIDLSESANRLVCGVPEHTCEVVIRVVK